MTAKLNIPKQEVFKVIFVWSWNENAWKNRNNKQKELRAIWLVYWMDTNIHGFWLVKRMLWWKNFTPENLLEINRYFTLMSYCNTIGQSNNAFSAWDFLLPKNEESMFWSFHPLADKTNNKHLLKPFFKVIQGHVLSISK